MSPANDRTEILHATESDIERAARALQGGELVSFPTETVYGLGANARDPNAVAAVFAAKNRPVFDPLIVHIAEPVEDWRSDPLAHLSALDLIDVAPLSSLARTRVGDLARAFWPGPLTLVLPRHASVADLITAGLETVAIRMPAHPVAQALLRASGLCLVGPSANRFGRISPTTANDVMMELEGCIPFVLDGGRAQVGVESTVILVEADGNIRLLRPGGLAPEPIAEVAGVALRSREGVSSRVAPGLLPHHYAPKKPMILLPRPLSSMKESDWNFLKSERIRREEIDGPFAFFSLLAFSDEGASHVAALEAQLLSRVITKKVLSPKGDLSEAARLLFGSIRVLDLAPDECIIAEPCPLQEGLGWAIQDRLQKASYVQEGSSRT